MTPQEKMDYSALIEELGGQVFDTQYFKTDCSHVVVGKPNRYRC
jgi:topoisomerase (DNA) II binding protein 1